ncbi:hypothetical protein BI364_10565 [Acidihalobacter yilgarnensis]|uniref:Cytochrome c domain-containing protein n=1 Tax=Acidihalobacter yilgarnensis TaxID=2819280 RepID=A0A1D8IPE2_9GAMM|nr:cytochrome c1 [Acidihalobacter yilgarnensis]AOU98347.1 hypothetical protein BI364_10565 [Acidihalobacter yilgarnensis]
MIKLLTKLATFLLLATLLVPVAQADFALKSVQIDTANKADLRNGAAYFMTYCMACHSIRADRFSDMSHVLGLPLEKIQSEFNSTSLKVHDAIVSPMAPADATHWFGLAPPDLSVIIKMNGANWVYTYLTSFYLDPSRATGVNNAVFHNVAMPDVLWQLQGLQMPVYTQGTKNGHSTQVLTGLKLVSPGTLTPAEFDKTMRDIVTFLYWANHPHQAEREHIGLWVMLFMALFIVVAYLLKHEYWRAVKH